MTRNEVKQIREEMNEALKTVAEKHNMILNVGNISYNDAEVNIKVNFKNLEKKEEYDDKLFKQYAEMFGLKPEDQGKSFTSFSGITMTISHLDLKKRKYPIICNGSDGRSYKLSQEQVQRGLKLNNA